MTSLVLLANAKQQFVDANGVPLALGTVGTYLPGTMTPVTTWQAPDGTGANDNPLTLDAAGRAVMWATGQVRQIVKDAGGNVVWDLVTGQDSVLTQLQALDACFVYDRDVVFRFDNAGLPISAGVLGDLYTTFAGTITGWVIQADQAGAIKLDIWAVAPYADNAPPTGANSIVAAANPQVLATNESASGGDQNPLGGNPLTGWTTALAAKTWWRINCVSATAISRFTLTLRVTSLAAVTFTV